MATEQDTQTTGPIFAIQRVYTKDISFESPSTPQIFREAWQPEVSLDLQTKTQALEEGTHEVVLSVTATAKQKDKIAFIVEIQQAGIFTLQGFPEEQVRQALGSMCPSILYPFAREAIASAVTHGGFPQLLLAPVNFEALYMQHLTAQSEKTDKAASMAN